MELSQVGSSVGSLRSRSQNGMGCVFTGITPSKVILSRRHLSCWLHRPSGARAAGVAAPRVVRSGWSQNRRSHGGPPGKHALAAMESRQPPNVNPSIVCHVLHNSAFGTEPRPILPECYVVANLERFRQTSHLFSPPEHFVQNIGILPLVGVCPEPLDAHRQLATLSDHFA